MSFLTYGLGVSNSSGQTIHSERIQGNLSNNRINGTLTTISLHGTIN